MSRQGGLLRGRHLAFTIAAVIVAVSCADSSGPNPGGHKLGDIPLSPALVSAPVALGGPAGSPTDGMAYVSMLPGTESAALTVTVSSTADGATVVAQMDDGGFDPIGIRAEAEDSLVVTVTGVDGRSFAYAKVPRRSRPVVVRTTPGSRRTDVVLNPTIHVVFNEPMDPTSLRDAVRLRHLGAIVPGTVTAAGVDQDFLTAIFTPNEPLAPNAEYELLVTADARSRTGEAIAEPVAVAFTTGSTTGPPAGTVVVTTSTTGPALGGTPYTVTLDGVSPWPIAGNASITIPNVPPGYHHLKLSGVGGSCTVAAKTPLTSLGFVDQHGFYLEDGKSVTLGWQIQCQTVVTTSLTVQTATTGVEIDPNGYEVHIAGVGAQRIDASGSAVFPNLAAGVYQLELRDLSDNCAASGHEPKRSVTLSSGIENNLTLGVTCTPDFHPAGVIAFTRDVGAGRSAVFTANADGTGALQVTDGSSRDFDPAWSADGGQLAFIREQGQQSFLYTVNADGSGLSLRYTGSLSSAPSWSPDGRRITMSTYGNGEVAVHVVNLDDGSLSARLGHPQGWASSPDWSPDGSRIAYSSDWHAYDFNYDIFVMNADGTNVRDAIFGSGAPWPTQTELHFSPDWSPDGSKLLVNVCRFGYYICWPDRWIAVATGDGTGLTRIAYDEAVGTPLDWVDPAAVWSPDGGTIAYHTTRCRGAQRCIRYVRSGGGGSSVTLEDAYDPAWKP